jgi:hypothetical protein
MACTTFLFASSRSRATLARSLACSFSFFLSLERVAINPVDEIPQKGTSVENIAGSI